MEGMSDEEVYELCRKDVDANSDPFNGWKPKEVEQNLDPEGFDPYDGCGDWHGE